MGRIELSVNGEEVGADNLIEKVLGLQWESGWRVSSLT